MSKKWAEKTCCKPFEELKSQGFIDLKKDGYWIYLESKKKIKKIAKFNFCLICGKQIEEL